MTSPRRQQPRRHLEVVPRSDQMGVCNDQKVPLADFQAMFCDRCLQVECTRSRVGGSRFEKRVANWYQDLFAAPPRMDPQDPRFTLLSAKKFLTIDTGPMPEVRTGSAWVDPRNLNEGAVSASSAPRPVTSPDPEFMKPLPRVIDPAPRQQVPGRTGPLNTPAAGPRMLGNAPPPAPKADPWAAAPTPKNTETVVAPGAKVRTGGSGPSGV